jgi:transposase-like protein
MKSKRYTEEQIVRILGEIYPGAHWQRCIVHF